MMGCCGGGPRPLNPAREPRVRCGDEWKTFAPVAWVIVEKFGIDPCSVTGTGKGGLVLRADAERAK